MVGGTVASAYLLRMLQPHPKFMTQARPLALARWLWAVAGLIVVMVVVGGITRLTESGLSITEWKPVTGAIPPMDAASWQAEFDDVLAQLAKQTLQQRIDELMTRMREVGNAGMTPAEKDELRELQVRIRA